MNYEHHDFGIEHPEGPMRALDLHLAQWEWSRVPGRLEVEYERLMRSSYGRAVGYTDEYAFYAHSERKTLNEAKTIYISPEMQDIAYYNAGVEFLEADLEKPGSYGAYQDEDGGPVEGSVHTDIWIAEDRIPVLRREMLPVESGFLVLGKPLPMTDYDDEIVATEGPSALPTLQIRAIAWNVADTVASLDGPSAGIVLYVYIDPLDIPGGKAYYKDRNLSVPALSMVDFTGWTYDKEFHVAEWNEPDWIDGSLNMNVKPHVAAVRMFLASVWGLMHSYIVREKPGRPQQKLAKRLKMPEDGDVTVIQLRKFLQEIRNKTEAIDYDEDGQPKWTHRWIVRGHWAWRNCKCLEHDGKHRVYIDPYVKGPEHLPLVIKEKVLSIQR